MNFNVFGISRRPPDILGQLALTTFATALNNVSTKLGAAYHAGSGILTVLPGDGAKFPPLVSPDFYAVTVIRGGVAYLPTVAPTDFTVFKVTGISGDNLTVSGLLDGTLDRDYAAQDVVELRVAATLLTTLQDAVNNVEYAVPPITSVFNRAGAVTAAAGDYGVGQVTGAAPLANPTFTGVPSAPTAAVGTNTTQLATTAFVIANAGAAGAVVSVFGRTGTVTAAAGDYAVGQVTGAAPLASPTFTGVPLAPTASIGTNTTQLATTAFVLANAAASSVVSVFGRTGTVTAAAGDYAVGQVTGAAPLASPTFTGVPLAPTASIGTNTKQIATAEFVALSYAPLASPAFTGTPIAPTATAGTNTTQIATTAFVVANALANPNPTLKGTTNFQTTGGTQLAHVDGTTGNYINDRGGGGDTYVGNLAGPNHTGQFSTFVGYQAGQNITTGDQNTALGVRTLNAATGSCSSNTAVGYGAMWDATTACNSNTAVGYNAMTGAANYATTSNNTAAGANALGAIGSNASGNAALGAQAGSINATGNNNTYVGYQAGNSGGGAPTRNTYVGYNANDNTAANYTQSTALGANARITASNQIVLGTATETTSIPGILAVTGAAIFGTIPTTQTATAGDNSTKVATTTFVQNALQSGLATCNGRLTLRSGDPVNAPGSSGGTLYFTPFNGNIIALYDGSTSWGFLTFAEKSLAVPVSTGVYDLFAYNNAGVVALETQAWTNISTRASNLAFQDGVYVKVGATTRRYLGTFYSASGTVSDIKAARNLFSYYNRVGKVVYNQDPGPDYPYTSIANVMSPMHSGSTGWRIYVVVGVQDNAIDIKVSTLFTPNTADVRYYIGVGLNQTTANNANYGVWRMDLLNIPMSLYTGSLSSPPLGYNFYNGLEQLTAGTSGTAFPTQATCGISGYWSC